MSFLFGNKKKGQNQGQAANARDGPVAHSSPSGSMEKEKLRQGAPPSGIPTASQPAHPTGSMNNSINSLGGAPNTDSALVSRPRPEADAQQVNRAGPPATSNGSGVADLYPWSRRELSFVQSINPFPRYGAAVNSVASKDGDVYIMGGLVNASTVKGDLWLIDAGKGLTCEPVKTEAEGPGPRVGHASLLVGNAFIVFGGDTKQEETDPLDDTLYLLNTSTKQWSRALPPGTRPAGRYGHTLNILGSKLYVFGGQVDGHFFNDLVAFDLNQLTQSTNRWEMLIPDTFDGEKATQTVPPGRTNHTIITYNDKLYLFGGTDGVQWFNDVWTYEPRTNAWTQQDCIGYIPQPREGHSAAVVNDVMYIFGGRTVEGNDLGDLAAFRITSRRWYTFQRMGPSPSPRSGHSMTAYNEQIVVLAGEPSSPERNATELSLVYILDTSKIRYPNDQQIQQTPSGERVAGNRRPSVENNGLRGPLGLAGLQGPPGPLGPPGAPPIGSRLPRAASASQSNPGPPPQQAPPPRANGSSIPAAASRSRTPTGPESGRGYTPIGAMRGPSPGRAGDRREMSPAGVGQRGPPSRSMSPAADPRANPKPPGPQSGPQSGPRFASAAAEEASVTAANGYGVSPQRQPRQDSALEPPSEIRDLAAPTQRFVSQTESQEKPLTTYTAPTTTYTAPTTMLTTREPDASTKGQIDGLKKELDEMKARNAWYASELALARKAGYDANTAKRMSLDGVTKSLNDEDKPLLEALITMRSELAEVQNSVASRVDEAAKKVAAMEQQRDAAVREAAYAKAKLAAHGGSQAGTPQLDDSSRDVDSDRSNDHVRKLGAALAMQAELHSKVEGLNSHIQAEKRAREVAEDRADAAQKRFAELDSGRNPGEVESLRAELHEAQRVGREHAMQLADAQSKVRMLEVDNEELKEQLEEETSTSTSHGSILTSLREAVTASHEKYSMLENKLQQEKENRENVQRKLMSLRTEHEERTSELENTTRKLRDAEDLADKHANEAERHRQVLISGLDKLNSKDGSSGQRAMVEKRVGVLQQQVDEANDLVHKSQGEAETAAEKLRRAEERIAGLEAYQQQASREGLGIRKQLQEALRNAQQFQTQHGEIKQQLESHQRDANALAIQHGALRDLLDERSSSSAARNLDSPSGGRIGSPDVARLRELESMLEESRRSHNESKAAFESNQHESDRMYRDKIEQLQQDYQSAVSYVKGAEKMLKRMKDELNKSKAQTARLQTEIDKSDRSDVTGEPEPADWEVERQGLRKEIKEMQDTMKGSVYELQQQVDEMRAELEEAQVDRDRFAYENEQIGQMAQRAQSDIDKLKGDNKLLESRAIEAETKVGVLLDQVESSVDNYRRRSQTLNSGGVHNRTTSNTSATLGHSHAGSISADSEISSQGTERNSLALDNLASELETLRTQWEGTRRSYRLSTNYDTSGGHQAFSGDGALSSSLAGWRRRLDAEERSKEHARAAAGGKPEGM